MNLIATHLAKRFLKRELIAEESLEWCIYGIEKRLSMFTTWTLLILLGSYCFGFRRTISFAVCFVALRKYSNGYHAKTYIHCLLLSLILQSVSMILIKALPTKFFGFVWIFSDFVILKIAPVNNNQSFNAVRIVCSKRTNPLCAFFRQPNMYNLKVTTN